MCDQSCINWGKRVLTEERIKNKKILEVGSLDVNGSFRPIAMTLNPLLYIGIDILKGKGVDIVCKAEEITKQWDKETFDVVITTCVFEHIELWKEAISNIKNILIKNGLIFFIVPAIWPLHEYPYDFWRYSIEDVKEIFADCIIEEIEYNSNQTLVYAVIKKPDNFKEKDLSEYKLFDINTRTKK